MISVLSNSPSLLQEVEQAADLVVGVRQEPGEHLHHPRREPARIGDSESQSGTSGSCRDSSASAGMMPSSFCRANTRSPVGIPAVVELAGVPVGPLLGHMMRRMRRAGAEMQVERLVRCDLLGVGDELDRLVRQVLGQVVALLWRPRRLDLVVVVDQVRVPLAGVTAQEAVEALESRGPAASGRTVRPPIRIPRAADGTCRPCRCCSRAAAASRTETRSRTGSGRCSPGYPVASSLIARHGVRMVITPGDDARSRRRAQRRGVHVVIQQAPRGQRVDVRRRDRAAVTAELPEPVSSSTMNSTFGEPGVCPQRPGHAGLDSSVVRPITPGNAVPGSYSFSGIIQGLRRQDEVLACPGPEAVSWSCRRRARRP